MRTQQTIPDMHRHVHRTEHAQSYVPRWAYSRWKVADVPRHALRSKKGSPFGQEFFVSPTVVLQQRQIRSPGTADTASTHRESSITHTSGQYRDRQISMLYLGPQWNIFPHRGPHFQRSLNNTDWNKTSIIEVIDKCDSQQNYITVHGVETLEQHQ